MQPKDLADLAAQRWDVFVSYAGDFDPKAIDDLVRAVRCSGLSIWYDRIDSLIKNDTVPDSEVEEMLATVITTCKHCLIFATPTYFSRRWPLIELRHIARRLREQDDVAVSVVRDQSAIETRALLQTHGFVEQKGRVKIFDPGVGSEHLADKITGRFERRSLLVMDRLQGPVDIGVFAAEGYLVCFPNGGLASSQNLRVRDLSGNLLSDQKFVRGHERLLAPLPESGEFPYEGVMKHFDEGITYGHINHLHMPLFSPEEVREGAALNLGTHKEPLVFYPFFTCRACTCGIVVDKIDPYLRQCLKIAKGSYKGNWRFFRASGGRFTVVGSED